LEQKINCVLEQEYELNDLKEQLRRLNSDQKYSKELEPIKKYDSSNIDYDNWTREQFIAEIERLKVENEQLKNNQTLTSSERQERIQQNSQKLEQLNSHFNQPGNSPSANNSPVNLAIGGVIFGAIGLVSFLAIKKHKKNK